MLCNTMDNDFSVVGRSVKYRIFPCSFLTKAEKYDGQYCTQLNDKLGKLKSVQS